MSIERNEPIRFHEQGTLEAVTRWIASHYDGIAEWFKNVRRQYQTDRADVALEHRVAVLLLKDAKGGKPARIGVLDVGGATLEDVTAWSTWQDPEASRRSSQLEEEETQGNGGKAYMYRLFSGSTRILGVRDRRRNCKGFEGKPGTVERGNPGWIPSLAAGRDVEISAFDAEVRAALQPYDTVVNELPVQVRTAIMARQAFTLVEGQEPVGLYKGRIDADDLIAKVVRHEQSTLSLEQVDFFVIHNGRLLNEGKRLQLPPITPYQGLESPIIHEIPDQLPLDNGQMVSTTEGGTRDKGRLTIHTSAENMPAAYKNLRPRWQIIYRTRHQMIGSKPVSEIAGATPGSQYVYGTVELPALEPAYVEHGRRRPKPGPLVEALDRHIAEKIKEVAHEINARRQQRLDQRALDEVQEENRKLNDFKNRFLPSYGEGNRGLGKDGTGSGGGGGGKTEWGKIPDEILYSMPEGGLDIGKGVAVALRPILDPSVRDAMGRPVRSVLEWETSDHRVAALSGDGVLEAKQKGNCEVCVRVKGTAITSEQIPIRVWNVDHVLLTPRTLDIPLGTRQQIVAEVTDDDGKRSTHVLLDWRHDAEDQLIVRISRDGMVTGNRIGRTAITAGAAGVWARIPVEVNVVENAEKLLRGSGFPKLLLTDRDLDPATGTVREGDPDQPPLWQDPSDFVHNVWWLNLQSPETAFAFRQRATNQTLWRTYHAQKVVDMVVQVWMTEEFTRKGESQRPEFWAAHLLAIDRHRVRIVQQMWKHLEPYVSNEESLNLNEEGT
ncbi:MAG TPA: hypothetical protein VGG03_01900 [Thermoanaerobaculia bacterium]|jgi:hypothetical protein